MCRLLKAGRLGVNAYRQTGRFTSRGRQDRGAVTQVEQRPSVAGDQLVELADVHLSQLTSGDHTHASGGQ
jgi:hypothetical protein